MKKFIVAIVIIILVVLGFYLLKKQPKFGPNGRVNNLPSQTQNLVLGRWIWRGTDFTDGRKIVASDNTKIRIYTIEFKENNLFTGNTDCNSFEGAYTSVDGVLNIGPVASTKVACGEGSLESEFFKELSETTSYTIVEGQMGDELRIKLWNNSGTMIFYKDNLNVPFGSVSSTLLDNATYRVKKYSSITLPIGKDYHLSFKDSSITANFCNVMDGPYILQEDNIQANLRGTDRLCNEPKYLMEMENSFSAILAAGAKFSLENSTLTLTGNDPEKTTFVFEKI